jgi:hypothetical protein
MGSMVRAGRIASWVAAAMACAVASAVPACTTELDPPEIDAGDPPPPDDAGKPDAPPEPQVTGLRFQWDMLPPAVNAGGTTFEITEIHLGLKDVRVIGDAAPGDDRTSLAKVNLDWNDELGPAAIDFPMAPPGLYSRFEFRVDDGSLVGAEYWIKGRLTLADSEESIEFEIEDKLPIPISVPLAQVELGVGGGKTVAISFHTNLVMASVDWPHVNVQNGKIKLGFSDPQMFGVRLALAGAFSASAVP